MSAISVRSGTATTETGPGGAPAPAKRKKARTRLPFRVRLRRDWPLLLMAVPAVLLVIAFNYLPMFGTVTAFEYYDYILGFWQSTWVGLQNFSDLFADPNFWHAFENTIVLSVIQLVLFFPVPIALALLLNSVLSSKIRSFVQAIVYLPHFFSWVLVIVLFQQMLGGAGLLNHLLLTHGMNAWNIMTDPGAFKYLVTAQSVWKEAGWGIIVFLAAIAAIDPALYEAAAADGANRWRRTWHITLPGMRGVIVLLLVLRLGNALNVGFEQFLIQRNAVGSGASEVLDTYSYYYGVAANNFGLGAAAGLFKGVVSLLLLYGANKVAHFFGEDGLYRGTR
ncbi:sugar ABC transporter permease [Actinospica sp. MGRD01-02]|uniref:Sugar ABC transporter permease n=1 Tax=Actinospica acidithermotolerans TaxID=2828514 RepID=A0A941IIX9_9ACTN|nr:ABC transporter permease subunit [Actinospica acidithermotolerans]MBR7825206.1 sugar ABC transporter permease [Actinospica acidithermotolerans]